jgi:hypothetical protein
MAGQSVLFGPPVTPGSTSLKRFSPPVLYWAAKRCPRGSSPMPRQRRENGVIHSFLNPRRIFANGMFAAIPLRRLRCTMLKLAMTG